MWLRSCEGGVVYGVLADGLGGDYTTGVWIEAWDVLTASNYALDKDRSRCACIGGGKQGYVLYGEVDYINELLPTARAC